MKNTCLWGFSYGPPYTEAWKNKINDLSGYLHIPLITTGRIDSLICKNKNVIIFKRNPIGNILFMIYSIWIMSIKYKNIIVKSELNSYIHFFYFIIFGDKIIHFISCVHHGSCKDILSRSRFYFKYLFPRLKNVVVSDKGTKDIMDKYTLHNPKIFMLLPWVNTKKFYYVPPPKITQFKILFASAPVTKEDFNEKGIVIMLKGFEKFNKKFNSKLIIVWREGRNVNLLNNLLQLIYNLELDKKVIIINKEIENMHKLYMNSHITILTNMGGKGTPDYPQSIIEALSTGRPVVSSKINEISDIIIEEDVGSICDLNKESVYNAILDCYNNYSKKQMNARYVAEKYFDIRNRTKQFEKMLS